MLARSIINPQLWLNKNKTSQLHYQLPQHQLVMFSPSDGRNYVQMWGTCTSLGNFYFLFVFDYLSYSVHLKLAYFIGILINRKRLTWDSITDRVAGVHCKTVSSLVTVLRSQVGKRISLHVGRWVLALKWPSSKLKKKLQLLACLHLCH